MSDPRDIVEAGYDSIASEHLDWIGRIVGDPRMRFLAALTERLPESGVVLDLGCGAGVPCTAALAEHYDVLGVDISAAQLELARRLVPKARFRKADIAAVDFPDGGFDAVTAFYSIGHVPRQRHAEIFARIAKWLRPGGLFLAALACGGTDGVEDDWLGAPMYFSSHDPATNRDLLQQAGFNLLVDELVTMREPEGSATFHWVIGQSAPAS
jgi:SAM-dependent methyltransferase